MKVLPEQLDCTLCTSTGKGNTVTRRRKRRKEGVSIGRVKGISLGPPVSYYL